MLFSSVSTLSRSRSLLLRCCYNQTNVLGTTVKSTIVVPRRTMASGHHSPKPEWTGIDKVVRSYFPEDYQLAMAIVGGYASLYVVVRVVMYFTGGKKSEIEAAPVVVSTSAIPSIESPEFSTYLESDAFLTLLNSEEQLTALLK